MIFESDCRKKISAMAKMSYISCLMYWFEGKPANMESCKGFDISKAETSNFNKHLQYFLEMQDAGLIVINEYSITFINHWYKHIDKQKLERASPEEYIGMMNWTPAENYKQELLNDGNIYDLLGMRYRLTKDQITEQINDFLMEQKAVKKHYASASECIKHCINWINKKGPSLQKSPAKSTSNNKILGR